MTDFKKRYGKIYSEVWAFHEKYADCDDSDETWEQIIRETDELYKKHPGNRFYAELLMAVLDEIERETMLSRESMRKT